MDNFYIKDICNTVSKIPSRRKERYKKAVEFSKKNKMNSELRYGLSFDISNLDQLRKETLTNGTGFNIDTSIDYTSLERDEDLINSDSVFSYKFGFSSDDSSSIKNKRCSCSCGMTTSIRAGEVCRHCGDTLKPVEYIYGWIKLDNFKVFNVFWLNRLYSHMRQSQIKIKRRDIEKSMFSIKGEYFNILDYQNDKENIKKLIYDAVDPEFTQYFIDHIDDALTSSIPVVSKDYRYYKVMDSLSGKHNIRSHPLNKEYISISDKVEILNKSKNLSNRSILDNLKSISERFQTIHDEIMVLLGDGKDSLIRGKTISRRYDNSCRLVLEGLTESSRVDVCTLPYHVFGEITINPYKDYYDKHGATPEAYNRMRNNLPNDSDREIMKKVLSDLQEDCLNWILVYRAPCIYMGSQIMLEIIGLTNADEPVIKINSITIESNLHGDCDGDITGQFIKGRETAPQLSFALNPKRIYYNPITGKYNDGCNLLEGLYLVSYLLLDNDEIEDGDIMNSSEFNEYIKSNFIKSTT